MKTIYFKVSIPKIIFTKLLSKPIPEVYYYPVSPVQYKEIPDRDLPGGNWVRVKNRQAGICGADVTDLVAGDRLVLQCYRLDRFT